MPSAVTVTEGGTLSLLCDVTNSSPPPSVRNQAGNYICVATADDGSTRSSTAVVTVT